MLKSQKSLDQQKRLEKFSNTLSDILEVSDILSEVISNKIEISPEDNNLSTLMKIFYQQDRIRDNLNEIRVMSYKTLTNLDYPGLEV